MCGRFLIQYELSMFARAFALEDRFPESVVLPFPVVRPGSGVPVVVRDDEGRHVSRAMRWGFPASWLARQGKDIWRGPILFNAKIEKALKGGYWKEPLRQRRCLVPTNGYYEWLEVPVEGRKKPDRYPVLVAPTGQETLTLAGIWGSYARGEETVDCVSILTCPPNETVSPLSDRMPVVLPPEAWETWLDPEAEDAAIDLLLVPAPAAAVEVRAVNRSVAGVKQPGPDDLVPDWSLAEVAPELVAVPSGG